MIAIIISLLASTITPTASEAVVVEVVTSIVEEEESFVTTRTTLDPLLVEKYLVILLVVLLSTIIVLSTNKKKKKNHTCMPGWIPWCQDKKEATTQHPQENEKDSTTTSNSDELLNSYNNDNSTLVPTTTRTSTTTTTTTSLVGGPLILFPTTTTTTTTLSIWDHIYWKRPITVIEDLLTMGNCLARGGGTPLIENVDGNEQDFHSRYIEDRVLGEGEFGVVKLIHDMKAGDNNNSTQNSLACKTIRKGVTFKDNTIYSPLKPEIIQAEVEILRTLNGEHYCMELKGVYETPRAIFMVTEYCAGGEMMEYVSKQEEDLRTDDVSRIAFQMLDAVNHCAVNNIIHRDIKPDKLMFQHFSGRFSFLVPIHKQTFQHVEKRVWHIIWKVW